MEEKCNLICDVPYSKLLEEQMRHEMIEGVRPHRQDLQMIATRDIVCKMNRESAAITGDRLTLPWADVNHDRSKEFQN